MAAQGIAGREIASRRTWTTRRCTPCVWRRQHRCRAAPEQIVAAPCSSGGGPSRRLLSADPGHRSLLAGDVMGAAGGNEPESAAAGAGEDELGHVWALQNRKRLWLEQIPAGSLIYQPLSVF
jgi:hypothetical protein